MEVALFGALAGAGWLLSRARSSSNSSNNGGVPVAARLGDGPSQNDQYDSRYLAAVRADEASRATVKAHLALDPAITGIVPGYLSNAPNKRRGGGDGGDGGERVRSSLSGLEMPAERFTHNNMQPFYRSQKQNMSDEAFSPFLADYSGVDRDRPYGKKIERPPLFQPAANVVRRTFDSARDATLAHMPEPRNRAHEAPAPVIVGRAGVRGGETGDVYYDSRSYQMPYTTDQLRSADKPKLTFEGRVLPGLSATTGRAAVTMQSKAPSLVTDMGSPADGVRTTGAVLAATMDQHFDAKDTERQNPTEYIGAPGVAATSMLEARYECGSVPHRAQLSGPQTGPATGAKQVTDYGAGSVQIYANERDLTSTRVYQGNFVTAVKAMVAPITDLLRYTRKEDYDDAPFRAFGNVGPDVPKLTVYDANDVARTTIKQTGLAEAPAANLRGPSHKLTIYDPEDVARTARKETTLRDGTYDGTLAFPVSRTPAHDPDDVQKPTGRQTLDPADTVRNPGPSRGAGKAYDPDAWTPGPTHKQVLTDAGKGDYADGNIGALQNSRGGAYAVSQFDAHPTSRQYLADSGVAYGTAAGGPQAVQEGGYGVAPLDIRDVQRAHLSDADYFGTAGTAASADAAMSHAAAQNARAFGDREIVEEGRAPTQTGVKVVAGSLGSQASLGPQVIQFGSRDLLVGRVASADTVDKNALGRVTKEVAAFAESPILDDRLALEASINVTQRQGNPYDVSV